MSVFKITDAVRIRQFVLEQLLRASASIKGWEVRNGAELLVEAQHVETWIKTGKRPPQKKATNEKEKSRKA